jgi:hypothetical protein
MKRQCHNCGNGHDLCLVDEIEGIILVEFDDCYGCVLSAMVTLLPGKSWKGATDLLAERDIEEKKNE